ncbi:ClpXP protease specificity-enhancing factor [Bisgaard Taxon 10/6]|uniref:ClpXP protease specificity-enhancing factor n=1 Tax=Exercitatus varius TaxID=67857 RepID=A0AAW6QE55_9PAST|nr:ClpXP protease specificity-enhancing factor [Exercitatus varius]MDG2938722.1 ClpXP protease specificity-enhancing factor [Exercitatus varius]MDG2946076.1 ClpXP protease specificity-enhancing factor [Exercitatus varius]MDG2950465.1 ClpXP protease specificity-enhancing factor [Exercitatus varius]MDG2955402.1 ClpXP protease specificity-enhancing factor [Exercitatus varius]MDG2962777.1 ClpXP protease specificity-enhancing factor [Exercitatus varius]
MEFKSSPKRPYLLRAYYDWLLDNGFTPYLVVDATYYGVDVPQEYVKDGQIVLNLSEGAVGNLALGNDAIEFSARFQGIPRNLYIPMGAAIAIYARENGDGVMFEPESIYDELDKTQLTPVKSAVEKSKEKSVAKKTSSDKKSASHLRIIK